MGGFFNGRAADTFTGNRVIANHILTWAVATYDGAHLRTYVARGDGTHLALDRSVARTGTLNTGAMITGIDENLVVGAKHRQGHAPGGTGTNELAQAFFNGTMSRFLVYATALWDAASAIVPSQIQRAILLRTSAGVAAGLLKNAAAAASTRLESQGVQPGLYRTVVLPSGSAFGRPG